MSSTQQSTKRTTPDRAGRAALAPSAAVSVPCLHAHARVADARPEVMRAREQARRGDAAWRRRLERYERGDTLIVALTASAAIDSDGTRSELLCFGHEIVWIDRQTPVGVLTELLRELAHRDFQAVGAQLRDHGVELSASEGTIAVRVVIDAAVADCLEPTAGPAPPPGASRAAA